MYPHAGFVRGSFVLHDRGAAGGKAHDGHEHGLTLAVHIGACLRIGLIACRDFVVRAHAGQSGHLFFQGVQLFAFFLADLFLGLHVGFQFFSVRLGLGQLQPKVGQLFLDLFRAFGGGHVIQYGLPLFRRQGRDAVTQQAQVTVAKAELLLHLHEVTAEGRQVLQVFVDFCLAIAVGDAELLPGSDGHGLAAGPVGDAGALVSLAVADLGEQLEHGHAVGRLVVLKGGDHARRLGNAQALRKLRLGHHGGILPQFVHIGAGGLVTHDVRRRGSRAVKGTAATGRGGDDGGIHIFHQKFLCGLRPPPSGGKGKLTRRRSRGNPFPYPLPSGRGDPHGPYPSVAESVGGWGDCGLKPKDTVWPWPARGPRTGHADGKGRPYTGCTLA